MTGLQSLLIGALCAVMLFCSIGAVIEKCDEKKKGTRLSKQDWADIMKRLN